MTSAVPEDERQNVAMARFAASAFAPSVRGQPPAKVPSLVCYCCWRLQSSHPLPSHKYDRLR